MKLHTTNNSALNTVTGYGAGFVEINKTRFEHAIFFGPLSDIQKWPAHSPTDISHDLLMLAAGLSVGKADPMAFLDADEDAEVPIIGQRPEVLLIGTGARQVLLGQHVIGKMLRIGVGVECMSTQAAARTYNILMEEGRQVVAALIPE